MPGTQSAANCVWCPQVQGRREELHGQWNQMWKSPFNLAQPVQTLLDGFPICRERKPLRVLPPGENDHKCWERLAVPRCMSRHGSFWKSHGGVRWNPFSDARASEWTTERDDQGRLGRIEGPRKVPAGLDRISHYKIRYSFLFSLILMTSFFVIFT